MTGRVVGGFNQYGFTVGILMLDTRFPRIAGDMGNATTFDFPVRYHRVSGADPDLVVRRGASGLLPAFIAGARALEREGVGAITTNCGFLVNFQRELSGAVNVPVITSSLLLVPLVHRMLAPRRRVGILPVNAGTLTPEHLEGAGVGPDSPLAIAGLETEKEFTRVLLGDELELDVDAARDEHVKIARRLVADHPDIGAIVLECTNMPPYTLDIQRATRRPVFDAVSLVRMVTASPVDLAGSGRRWALEGRLGVDVGLPSPDDARALVPALRVDDLIGAVWGPEEGMAGPAEVTAGFARRARELGARIVEGVEVSTLVVEHGRVAGVRTSQGDVGTRVVINAAGPTAARVARLAGVSIPVLPRRRHIFFTEPFPEVPRPVPLTTDRASGFYFRKEMEQLLLSPRDVEDVGADLAAPLDC